MRFSYLIILLVIILNFILCTHGKKIIITDYYIQNSYWDKYDRNIKIEKMKIKKDSSIDIFNSSLNLTEPNHWNIIRKLEIDSTYRYLGYIPLDKIKKAIYFNKFNAFYWYSMNDSSGNQKLKVIGNLEYNSWYKFSKLTTGDYYVFVYVDSIGKTHKFVQNLANY